jgi:iron(III) transport system substrate-binding protein
VQLLEFLTDAEAQTLYSEINFEYPANPAVEHTAELQSWGSFTEDKLPILRIAELSRQSQQIIDRVGW